jgi:hypothetical protein
MPAKCMVRGSKSVGAELQQWHFSMGDPIYQVGSHWYAGKPVPCAVAEKALREVQKLHRERSTLYGRSRITGSTRAQNRSEVRSLAICVRALKAALSRKGVS